MKYKLKDQLTKKKSEFPLNKKGFSKANAEADVWEKKHYPKGYQELKKIGKKMGPNEIEAHVNAKGKITVSKKVPKNLRKEAAAHDKYEYRKLKSKK